MMISFKRGESQYFVQQQLPARWRVACHTSSPPVDAATRNPVPDAPTFGLLSLRGLSSLYGEQCVVETRARKRAREGREARDKAACADV